MIKVYVMRVKELIAYNIVVGVDNVSIYSCVFFRDIIKIFWKPIRQKIHAWWPVKSSENVFGNFDLEVLLNTNSIACSYFLISIEETKLIRIQLSLWSDNY